MRSYLVILEFSHEERELLKLGTDSELKPKSSTHKTKGCRKVFCIEAYDQHFIFTSTLFVRIHGIRELARK